MNGRESRLTRIILSEEENRIKLTNRIKQNKSIVGTVFNVSGRKYKITIGDLRVVDKRVQMFKNNILSGLSR